MFLTTVKGHAEIADILKKAGMGGGWLWKYMVIMIWIVLGYLPISTDGAETGKNLYP